jgi:hypothetical protein
MASLLYDYFKSSVMDAAINLTTATVYCLLVNGYTALSSHQFRSSVTSEVSTTNYTTGGVSITTLTVTTDTTNHWGQWGGANVAWSSVTLTATGAVVYKSTGAASTDNLICYFDFGGAQTATNGTFTVQWSTAGIIHLS